MLNTVFFGTPQVAVPFLERLARKTNVLAVVTAPDKPAGRGYALAEPAVKKTAQFLGLPVKQPETMNGLSVKEIAGGEEVDVGVVVAYGQKIPSTLFNQPRLGMMNVHFSLLPKYRGAGPVQWALIRGETETGVTLFRIEEGMDTGPIFLQKAVPILSEDNAPTLRERLENAGLSLLDEFVDLAEKGALKPRPQTGTPTPAPSLKKEDGLIRWAEMSGEEVVNLIRGVHEWPGAVAAVGGKSLKIMKARPWPMDGDGKPGEIAGFTKEDGFIVRCKSDGVLVIWVQPEGRNDMSALDFWNGARLKVGDVLG